MLSIASSTLRSGRKALEEGKTIEPPRDPLKAARALQT